MMQALGSFLSVAVFIGLVLFVAGVQGRAAARRENMRRRMIYLEECLEAKRRGLPLPVPPDTVRWG